MTSEPKRHHYVPRMLLRQWHDGTDCDHVWVMDRHDRASARRAHVNDVMVVKHFYTGGKDRAAEEPDWFFESVLAEWEAKVASALPRLLAIPAQLSAPTVPWLFFQLVRTPQGQAALADDLVTEIRKHAAREGGLIPFWMHRKGRAPTEDEALALADASARIHLGEDHRLLEPGTTDLLNAMFDLVAHSDFGKRLWSDGVWTTIHTDPDTFAIGDFPVTYRGQHNPARALWRQDELPEQLTLPIRHDVCLEIRRKPREQPLSGAEIDQINVRTWHWSDRWIVARSREALDDVVRLSESTECRNPRPEASSPPRRR